jgi:hypothetical protein
MKKILLFVIFIASISGCEPSYKSADIFVNPVCEPPCWENITPGITTKEDALSILSKKETIDKPINNTNLNLPGYDGEINFTLHKDKSQLGFMLFLNDKISAINFHYKMELTLQEAIKLFGTPQFILGIHSGEINAITLLDPQKGVAFSYFLKDSASEIKPQDKISDVTFFDPNTYQLLLNNGVFSWDQMTADEAVRNMRPWEGFGSIDQYMTPLPP